MDPLGEGFVVRMRGLPWSSTSADIVSFFSPLKIRSGTGGVQFTFTPEGRPSGEAFVEFTSTEERDAALKKHNDHMGSRYIEVFKSKKTEMDWVLKRVGDPPSGSGAGSTIMGIGPTLPGGGLTKVPGAKAVETVVKLRGLPYDCSKEDIESFFSGHQIIPNGILFVLDAEGRRSGEAFVEFISSEEAEKAQKKHRQMMAHRYVEVFKSSRSEMKRAETLDGRGGAHYSGRPAPYEKPRPDYDVGGHNRYGSGYERRYRAGATSPAAAAVASTPATAGGQYYNYYDATYGQGGGYGVRRDGIGAGGGGGGARDTHHHVVVATAAATAMGAPTAHRVRMRGLPFSSTEDDIMSFFAPLNPVSVQLEYERSGRASGEAGVYFATHEEAGEAMGKNRQMMGHRYIELFLHSTPTRTPLAQVGVPAASLAAAGAITAQPAVIATVNQYAIAPPGVAVTEQQLITTAYPATSIARTTMGAPGAVSVSGAPLLPSSIGAAPVISSIAPTVPLTANPQINAANMAAAVAALPRDTQTNFTF